MTKRKKDEKKQTRDENKKIKVPRQGSPNWKPPILANVSPILADLCQFSRFLANFSRFFR